MSLGYTTYQGRSAWYLKHGLVPKDIYEFLMEDGKTKAAVMECAPSHRDGVNRPFWTYMTNGMSERRMPCVNEPHGDPQYRLELVAYSQQMAPWIIELLKAMAIYPFQYQSGFAVGHTIPVNAPGIWNGYVLVHPFPEPEDFNPLAIDIGIGDDWVFFAQVLGLVGAELGYGIEQGGPELELRLREQCPTRDHLISRVLIERDPLLSNANRNS